VIERLNGHTEVSDEYTWMAENWLAFGVNRKITKRAVMVLPYGGTYKSCSDYVRDAVRERFAAGQENCFGESQLRAEAFLASLVWNSIGDVVVAAREAMSWLQACARVATKAGKPLRWTTPSGFVVCQQYRELADKRIETKFCGSTIKFASVDEKDELDRAKQTSAVSPNFVHSLDASALMLTIGACLDGGITSFAMIHDSYGTHAADTDQLATVLRREFVRMYLDHDVLSQFREAVAATLTPEEAEDLPPVPSPGSLDLLEVLNSAYFFA
jgi:DNA-directed RNA polymerase